MSNRHIQIADAIVTAINAAALGVAASRVWKPGAAREDLATGVIQVVPVMFASGMADRAKMRELYGVDVGIQKEVAPDVVSDCDTLHDLLHTIRALFEGQRLSGLTAAMWQATETVSGAEAGYATEHLEAQRVFTGVLRFTFMVIE